MNCVGLPWFRRGLGPVLWVSAVGAWGGVCWFRFRVADLAFRVELRVGPCSMSRFGGLGFRLLRLEFRLQCRV